MSVSLVTLYVILFIGQAHLTSVSLRTIHNKQAMLILTFLMLWCIIDKFTLFI